MCPSVVGLPTREREGQLEPSPKRLKIEKSEIESQSERRFEKKVKRAKRAARSELSVTRGDWCKEGYKFTNICSTDKIIDTLPRVDGRTLTKKEFIEKFEKPKVPVVLTHLCDSWPAYNGAWSEESLLKNYANHKFKVGSDDDGYGVRLKFKHFLNYVDHKDHGRVDDSPLVIFDGTFADRDTSKSLVHDYTVPEFFSEDLMALAGESRRPPYRWFVVGPARSGTGVHVDPLATSAWNALISGHKRWALFPPGTDKSKIKPPNVEGEAVSWFHEVYPRTQRTDWQGPKPIDIIQGPGETVFVPAGWWHAVINLDLTVAVTQNFCSTTNFPDVWRHCRKGRPRMSARWVRTLYEKRPDLARIAEEINRNAKEYDDNEDISSPSSSSSSDSSSSSESGDDEATSGGK